MNENGGIAGFCDWRVPHAHELMTLMTSGRGTFPVPVGESGFHTDAWYLDTRYFHELGRSGAPWCWTADTLTSEWTQFLIYMTQDATLAGQEAYVADFSWGDIRDDRIVNKNIPQKVMLVRDQDNRIVEF